MALLKVSIKWKLCLTLVLTGVVLVGAYIVLARRTFEEDKISYVYDTQSAQMLSLRAEIAGKVSRTILLSRNMVTAAGNSSEEMDSIFNGESSMRGFELLDEKGSLVLLRRNKLGFEPKLISQSQPLPEIGKPGLSVDPAEPGVYVVTLRYIDPRGKELVLKVWMDIKDLNENIPVGQNVMLVKNQKVVTVLGHSELGIVDLDRIASILDGARTETFEYAGNTEKFLISFCPLGISDIQLVFISPEDAVLGALQILFRRSLVFAAISFFTLVIVSLLLSRKLTSNLQILTGSAKKIGSGDFQEVSIIKTNDEMGILSDAFNKMSIEIQRLLIETREKARMEQELKTASDVQAQLMPEKTTNEFNEIEVNGMSIMSSECGGDWWHYFEQGDDVFIVVGDATGHGTPAALITAASRSIFSKIERDRSTLGQMMSDWSDAVRSCSAQRVFMTGIILRINTKTGQGSFVNAAHEPPFLFRQGEVGDYDFDILVSDSSPRLGDLNSSLPVEHHFELGENSFVLIYTDGVFASVGAGKRPLSEKKIGKHLSVRAEFLKTASQLNHEFLKLFEDSTDPGRLEDDLTIVAVRRTGSKKKVVVESEEGGLAAI